MKLSQEVKISVHGRFDETLSPAFVDAILNFIENYKPVIIKGRRSQLGKDNVREMKDELHSNCVHAEHMAMALDMFKLNHPHMNKYVCLSYLDDALQEIRGEVSDWFLPKKPRKPKGKLQLKEESSGI